MHNKIKNKIKYIKGRIRLYKSLLNFKLKNPKFKRKLKKYRGSGKLITLNGEKDRCTGKTTLLIQMAKKYNLPVLVPSGIQVKWYERKGARAFPSKSMDNLRGRNEPNGFLIEEGVSMTEIEELERIGFKVNTGFYYNTNLIK